MFNLKSLYNYKTYLKYDRNKTPTENDRMEMTSKFMCIESKIFLRLCDLYPQTATNLKYRSLERREHMMNQFRMANRIKFSLLDPKKVQAKNVLQSTLGATLYKLNTMQEQKN